MSDIERVLDDATSYAELISRSLEDKRPGDDLAIRMAAREFVNWLLQQRARLCQLH